MPYVVFIAPPSLQQLRRQKEILGEHGIKDEQLKLILTEGKTTEKVSIETMYETLWVGAASP